jgi:hypothetical protein
VAALSGRLAVFREIDRIFFCDICSQIPITKLVENLISFGRDHSVWLEFILDALISSSITRADKIVALELMGAVFIFWWSQNKYIGSIFETHLFETSPLKGIQCWKDALILRGGEPAIPNWGMLTFLAFYLNVFKMRSGIIWMNKSHQKTSSYGSVKRMIAAQQK